MNHLRVVCTFAAIAAISLAPLAATPAMAADDETGFVDENYNGFREVVGEGEDAYWSVSIRRDSAYIATWERDPKNGVWESPEQALDAINKVEKCVGEVQLAFISQFTTHDQFAAHPSSKLEDKPDGSFTWGFTEGSAEEEADLACREDYPWTTEFVTTVEADDPGMAEIQIPLSTLGPGTHKLFFMDVERLPTQRYDFSNGAWAGYVSGYEAVGEVKWITVAVPVPTSETFPFTTVVEDGALADPSDLARSAPPFLDADAGAIGGAALPALGGALALTAVIGVPTALFRSRSRKSAAAEGVGGSDE